MKKNTIQYREIKKSDYPALENIIANTWKYEKFADKKTALNLARVYLASCLTNQTFTCVALFNETPIGIIMGKNEAKHHVSIRYLWHQIISIIKMICFKEGRKVLKIFEGYENINKDLFSTCNAKFQGEVAFFVVDTTQRGSGIGKELFNKLQAYMRSQRIKDYYLFTDSSCNFGFYDHIGLQRYAEKKLPLKAFNNKEMNFYIYGTSEQLC
ncbi:MAG: GNAT family N-acetyltransferase [Longicatena sp.]